MNLTGQAIVITRKAAGSYVLGRWVEGVETAYSVEANVQPLNGHELLQLPEGDRLRENKKIYTAFPVQNNDILTLGGKTWQVQNAMDWSNHPLPHYKARITLIEGQE